MFAALFGIFSIQPALATDWSGLPPVSPVVTSGSNNTLTVEGTNGTFSGFLVSVGAAANTYTDKNVFENNVVTIQGGTYNNINVLGAISNIQNTPLDIKNNTFYVNGGTFSILRPISDNSTQADAIHGNKAYLGGNTQVNNTLLIFDVTKTGGKANLYDNYVKISGGTYQQTIANNVVGGDITHNELDITGGTFNGLLSVGKTGTGTVSNNVLRISGGTFAGDIAGGVAGKDAGTVNNNTIYLGGTADVSTASIFGGGYTTGTTGSSTLSSDNVAQKYLTGNTLVVDHWTGSAKNIYNLAEVDFRLNNTVENDDTILTLTNGTTTLGSSDGGTTSVGLQIDGGAKLNVDDRIHLLHNEAGINGVLLNNNEAKQGISIIYDGMIEKTFNSVDFHITGKRASEESTTVPEGTLPGLGLLISGSDLMMRSVLFDGITREQLLGKHVFGIVSGGHKRYETNTSSSFAVDSVNLITGANYAWAVGKDMIEAGAFFEAGWGNADTATHTSVGKLSGSGNMHYYGGGLMTRYEVWDGASKGLYADASARMGKLHNRYSNGDVRSSVTNEAVGYDISPTYYALHGGLGYVFPGNSDWNLDVSGRYFWTRISDSSVNILGDTYDLDTLTSRRVRLGTRLNYLGNRDWHPFVKLSYEYEFDATAAGTVHDVRLRETSLQGSTGIAEFGFSYQPPWNKSLNIDASASLYEGRQSGVMGNVRVIYAF